MINSTRYRHFESGVRASGIKLNQVGSEIQEQTWQYTVPLLEVMYTSYDDFMAEIDEL